MARLVQADREATVTLIAGSFNIAAQKSISELTTRQTFDGLHQEKDQVPLLSAKNRKLGPTVGTGL